MKRRIHAQTVRVVDHAGDLFGLDIEQKIPESERNSAFAIIEHGPKAKSLRWQSKALLICWIYRMVNNMKRWIHSNEQITTYRGVPVGLEDEGKEQRYYFVDRYGKTHYAELEEELRAKIDEYLNYRKSPKDYPIKAMTRSYGRYDIEFLSRGWYVFDKVEDHFYGPFLEWEDAENYIDDELGGC